MDFESAFKEVMGSSEASLQGVKQMLDTFPLITFIQHVDKMRFIYVSPNVESILGLPAQDLMQGVLDPASLVHPDDLPRLREIYTRLAELSGSEIRVTEFRLKLAAAETWHWLRLHYSILKREAGNRVTCLIGYVEDVTAQKAAEGDSSISRAGGQMPEEPNRPPQSHFYQAARLASIGQLASTLAHQLYNPLSTVIAEAQLLAREPGQSESAQASSKAILEAGWRAQRVIEALLILSQPARNNRVEVSIQKTIQNALALTESHFAGAGLTLSTDLPEGLEIVGDPQQITDLWLNLLMVPFFLAESDRIKRFTIQAHSRNERVVISFKNDGMQLTKDEAEHIFEPQSLPYKSTSGHGLELTICREIVHQHGGNLTIRREGDFTIFEVLLPLKGTS